jgi:hypothetical protein
MRAPLWVFAAIIATIVLAVIFPTFGIALVPIGLLGILAYAVGFGFGPLKLSPRTTPDRPLLDAGNNVYGGVLAAVVAVTGLAGLTSFEDNGRYMALGAVFVLGIAVAFERRSTVGRDALYLCIGVGATVLAAQSLLIGDCRGVMPSQTAALLALAPVVVMVVTALLGGGLLARGLPSLSAVGALALAAFALIELAAAAVAPAGIPVLAEASPRFAIGALALLSVIAALVGLRPRAGADLVALGLLALTVFFLGFDTPCGLALFDLVAVAVALVGGMLLVGFLRAR